MFPCRLSTLNTFTSICLLITLLFKCKNEKKMLMTKEKRAVCVCVNATRLSR